MDTQSFERQRQAVLEQMSGIRSMRPGSISEQYLNVRLKGQTKPVLRGPYYLWQYYEKGKPVRRRLTSPQEIELARQEIANHKRFTELCKEYENLTRRLGQAEREQAASQEAVKKKPVSRPRRTPK